MINHLLKKREKSGEKEYILKEKETLEDWSHQSLKGNSFSMGKDDIRLHAYVLKFPTDISHFSSGLLVSCTITCPR